MLGNSQVAMPDPVTRLLGPLRRLLWSAPFYRAALIFLLAFGLRYAWISLQDVPLAHDGWFYYNGARTLAAGDGYRSLFTGMPTANMPPGYPLVLSALYVVFGTSIFLGQLFNAAVGAIAAALTYVLARWARDERTGLVGGVLMALFPSQIFFSGMVMTESLFVALSVILVLVLVWWLPSRHPIQPRQMLALGLLLGFMSLVRAEVPLLAVLLVVLWKACGKRWSEIGRSFLLLAVGMAAIITPWTVRNYIQLDQFMVIRGGGDSIPFNALRRSFSPDFDDPKYVLGRTPAPSVEYLVHYYAANPLEMPKHGWRKLDVLFGRENPFYPWTEAGATPFFAFEKTDPWETLGDAYYYAVGLVALLGAPLWLRRRDRSLLVLLWFAVSWSVIHLVFVPQARYHYPILPVVCILAAMTLVDGWRLAAERVRSRSSSTSVDTAT